MRTWPAQKLISRIRQLPPDSQLARQEMGDLADWSKLAENVARLVDLVEYWLRSEYAKWTATEEEIEAARRNRKKPPPFPIVPPVAERPQSIQDRLRADYEAITSEFTVDTTGPRMVTEEEFDDLLDKWM
jgi:hypothetical protein